MAHDDPNSSASRDGEQPASDPSTAFQALVSELSEKLDEARRHLDQSGSAFRRLVEQTQTDLEATVRRELTAALPEAEAPPPTPASGTDAGTLRAAVEQIDGAESQAEVLSRMLEQLGRVCGRAALLLGQSMDPIETQSNLSVWNAVGFGHESFDGIDVDVPSGWRPALVADAALQLSPADAAPVTEALGGDAADGAVLIPFVLRDAAYALLYVDDHGRELDADAAQLLCFVASQAMECLAVRTARPAATIRPLVEPSLDASQGPADEPAIEVVDEVDDDEIDDVEGPSTPTFFASPSLQGVGDASAGPPPIEDDSPTQTDGIPWPQEASDIEEPAPELIEAEATEAPAFEPPPEDLAGENDEPEPIDRLTAEEAVPTWIEAESETPSEGFVVGDQAMAEDTVEVVEPESTPEPAPEPTMPPPLIADSFVSAIDEPPAETFEPSEATPLTPPPPPPPIKPPAQDASSDPNAPSAAETESEEEASDDEGQVAERPQDGPPSGATPFLQRDLGQNSTAPPRPAAFDTLAPAGGDGPELRSGNETVAVPLSAPTPAPPPAARTPDVSAEEPAEIEVPKTPPATSPGSSEVRPPQNVEGPGRAFVRETSGDEDPRDDEARRLARLLVSELKLYNEDEISRGKRAGNIYQHLREDIDRSRRIYEERIAEDVRQRHDFLHEELVRGLADGNPDLLGM